MLYKDGRVIFQIPKSHPVIPFLKISNIFPLRFHKPQVLP